MATNSEQTPNNPSVAVGAHLLNRLKELGCDHMFGIPGDFILPFFDQILASDLQLVGPCNEMNGAYAADAYARLKGIGAMAVTYGPGSLSAVNSVAGAYAEHVPLVLISGGPETRDYDGPRLLHHVIDGKLDATVEIFKQITVSAQLLRDPDLAIQQIDTALAACMAHKLPIYLELARDIQTAVRPQPGALQPLTLHSDKASLDAAIADTLEFMHNSSSGAILLGHLIHREGLQDEMVKLLKRTDYPAATMLIGKADYLEHLPECMGTYQGGGSPVAVKERVEGSDIVLSLGTAESDFNLGGFSADLDDQQMVRATGNDVYVQDKHYPQVRLTDFTAALLDALPAKERPTKTGKHFVHSAEEPYIPQAPAPICNERLFDRLAHFVQPGDVFTADAGGLIEMTYIEFPKGARFIGQSYWAAIGYGFAAGLGACFGAGDNARVVCVEGDGSFQMTAQEISTMVRYDKRAIIIMLNNRGYTAERLIHEGDYNDIQNWEYHRVAEVFGGSRGVEVRTEGELETALQMANEWDQPGPFIINVHLDPMDASEAFKLMSVGLRSKEEP